MTKIENKNCKCSKKKKKKKKKKSFLYNKDIILPTEPYTYFLVGMTQKEREEGVSHTLLTVRLITYQHISLLSNIPL